MIQKSVVPSFLGLLKICILLVSAISGMAFSLFVNFDGFDRISIEPRNAHVIPLLKSLAFQNALMAAVAGFVAGLCVPLAFVRFQRCRALIKGREHR